MALLFNSTAPGTNANYYKYLDSSINGKIAKTDRIAEPTLLDFCLIPYDGSFVKLRRGNYITVDTVTFPKWFTGYVTNDPELTYLGTDGSHNPVWGYKYQATSDDYILNLSPLGIMPPFTNTTMGAVLKTLVAQLAPGKFDVTGVTTGQTIARYVVDPSKTFSDVVKEFTELSAYRFWANDGKLFFQQQDTTASPMIIDGANKHFSPARLTLTPSPEPIVNDAIVVGGIEPQGYMNEYFIGDSFTARFPMLSSIYGIDRSILLDDAFGSAIDTAKWAEFDTVNDFIQVANGYINALGGTNNGVYGVYLQSANLLPLEGTMRLTHGEYDFVSASSGVIAGLWTTTPSSAYTGCIYAIECSKSASNTVLKPIVNGTVDGSQTITVDYTKRYVMRTIANFSQVIRMQNSYAGTSSTGVVTQFGAGLSSAVSSYTTTITEINPSTGVQTNQWVWQNSAIALTTAQTFAYYMPIVCNDLHLSMTNVTISTPMQAQLEIKAAGAGSYVPKLIGVNDIDAFDGQTPIATITDANSGATTRSSTLGTPQYNPGNAALQFFKDSTKQTSTTPGVGDFIHLSYRRAGAAIARVTNFASIATERALWGDSGIRSLTKLDLSPLPRTAAEAEAAAAALITDGSYQHYEGTYEQWYNFGVTGQPMSGQILKFQNLNANMPSISAEELHEVITTFEATSGGTERFYFKVTFGRPDRLRQLLSTFGEQTDVFAPQDTAEIPDATSLPAVGLAYAPDVTSPFLVSVGSTQLNFNTGQSAPAGGGFEIRYTDDQWGADDGKNLILRTSSTTFAVPRTQRGKICFIKAYDARNKALFSEDFTNAAWIKSASCTVLNASGTNPDGDIQEICGVTITTNGGFLQHTTSVVAASTQFTASISLKGTAGQLLNFTLRDGAGTVLATTAVVFDGTWQRVAVTGTFAGGASGNARIQLTNTNAGTVTFSATRASIEQGTAFETAYVKTLGTIFGAYSRYAAGLRVAFPLIPPDISSATFDYTDILHPVMTINLPTVQQDIWGIEIRASNDVTVLKKIDLIDASFIPTWIYDNSSIKTRSLDFFVHTYNLLGEYSTGLHITATIPTPTMTALSVDDLTQQCNWTATNATEYFVETDKVSNSFANISFSGTIKATHAVLTPPEFFNQRWIRVTAKDAIGSGTNSVISHVYTPTAVVTFGAGEVQSVATPATPTTDPTVPGAYAGYASDYIESSWKDYSVNSGRSS
jgi:hypothetical protein